MALPMWGNSIATTPKQNFGLLLPDHENQSEFGWAISIDA